MALNLLDICIITEVYNAELWGDVSARIHTSLSKVLLHSGTPVYYLWHSALYASELMQITLTEVHLKLCNIGSFVMELSVNFAAVSGHCIFAYSKQDLT